MRTTILLVAIHLGSLASSWGQRNAAPLQTNGISQNHKVDYDSLSGRLRTIGEKDQKYRG